MAEREITDALISWFSKWYTFLLYIVMGLIGKFSFDLLSGRKMSIWKVLASTGAGLFVGFVSAVACVNAGYETKSAIIVPVCTLLSEKIMIALFSYNQWKSVLHDFFKYGQDKLK